MHTRPLYPRTLLLLSFFSAVLLLFIHQKFNAEMKQFNHYNISYSYSSRVLECHALFREMGACLSRVSKCSAVSYHLRLHPNNPSRPLYGPITHLPPDPKHPTIPSYLTTQCLVKYLSSVILLGPAKHRFSSCLQLRPTRIQPHSLKSSIFGTKT
jgi:hypothetical protein